MDFSNKLNILIELFNLKNKDLCDAVDINVTLLSKWRNGKRALPVTSDNFKVLCTFFADYSVTPAGIKALKSVFRFGDDTVFPGANEFGVFYYNWFSDEKLCLPDFYLYIFNFNNDSLPLVSNNQPDSLHLFEGIAGICSAYHAINEIIDADDKKKHIRMITDSNMRNRLISQQNEYGRVFGDFTSNYINSILLSGHKVSFLTDVGDELNSMWLSKSKIISTIRSDMEQADTAGNFEFFLYPKKLSYPSYYCIIVDDDAIIYGTIMDDNPETPIISVMTTQDNIIKMFSQYFTNLTSNSYRIHFNGPASTPNDEPKAVD